MATTFKNPDDPFEKFDEQMNCDHKDDYGKTIIIGEHSGDYPVCMNCGMRFPDSEEDRRCKSCDGTLFNHSSWCAWAFPE